MTNNRLRYAGRGQIVREADGRLVSPRDVVQCKCFTRNLPGIKLDELEDYAGKHDVTALRVFQAERLEHEVTFGAKPPQNWGRFAATYRARQQAYNNKAADPLTPEEELADTITRQKELDV